MELKTASAVYGNSEEFGFSLCGRAFMRLRSTAWLVATKCGCASAGAEATAPCLCHAVPELAIGWGAQCPSSTVAASSAVGFVGPCSRHASGPRVSSFVAAGQGKESGDRSVTNAPSPSAILNWNCFTWASLTSLPSASPKFRPWCRAGQGKGRSSVALHQSNGRWSDVCPSLTLAAIH